MAIKSRRVVTGLDAQGRSCVLFDDQLRATPMGAQSGVAMIWRSETVPADNSGDTDTVDGFSLELLNEGGTKFMLVEVEPNVEPIMHATDTIDYLVVLRGQVVLRLEADEVMLGPGDVIVDRGVIHGWSARGEESALFASIMIPANTVGAGARFEHA
jgi:quercetin dioxygenase-like cupin family protein